MRVKCKLLSGTAIPPKYSRVGDGCMDLFSDEGGVILAGKRRAFSTGIALELPVSHVAFFKDRSGLAFNHGITVLSGVLDANYRGELRVVLFNSGEEDYEVSKGDRIAQVMVWEFDPVDLEVVSELSDSNRGEDGFGSSGK